MSASLDKEERYVLAYLRSDRVEAAHWTSLLVKLLITGVFAVGFVNENRGLLFTAFGTLLLLDLHSAAAQPRWLRSIGSAVGKLETRVAELESAQRTDGE